MPKVNLKQITNVGKSVAGQVSGALENVAGAAGKGGFSVSAGPNGVSVSANFNELLKKTSTGNKISSPIKELFDNTKFKKSLIYPEDLDNQHYMIFKVMKERRLNKEDKRKIDTYQNIVLPIPSNLQVAYGMQYQNSNLGLFGGMAAGTVTGGELNSALSSVGDAVKSAINNATAMTTSEITDAAVQGAGVVGPAAVGALATTIGGKIGGLLALGATSGGIGAGLSVGTGMAINPHMAVVFQGNGFLSHQFTYKFIARNEWESETIREIINTFKYHMHPSYAFGNLAFQYPDEFEIEFADAVSDYLYDIGTCVLQNVSVNYNGEGIPLFFEESGAPVSIEIQLTFQETHIKTKNDFEDKI